MVQKFVMVCLLAHFATGATWQGNIPTKPEKFASLQRAQAISSRNPRGSLSAYFALKNIIDGRQDKTPYNYRPSLDITKNQRTKWKFLDIERTTVAGEDIVLPSHSQDTYYDEKDLEDTLLNNSKVAVSSVGLADEYRPSNPAFGKKRKDKRKRRKNASAPTDGEEVFDTDQYTRTFSRNFVPGAHIYGVNSVDQVNTQSDNYGPKVNSHDGQRKERKQASEGDWSKQDVLLSSGKLNIEDVIRYVKSPIRPQNKNGKKSDRKKKIVRTIDEPNHVEKRYKHKEVYQSVDPPVRSVLFDSMKKLRISEQSQRKHGSVHPKHRKPHTDKKLNYVTEDEAERWVRPQKKQSYQAHQPFNRELNVEKEEPHYKPQKKNNYSLKQPVDKPINVATDDRRVSPHWKNNYTPRPMSRPAFGSTGAQRSLPRPQVHRIHHFLDGQPPANVTTEGLELKPRRIDNHNLQQLMAKTTNEVYQSITKNSPSAMNDDKTKLALQNLSGCYIEEIAGVIPYDSQIAPIGFCYSIECTKHRLYYSSCSKVDTEDNKCYITDVDTTKTYPDCCPQVKCVNDNRV